MIIEPRIKEFEKLGFGLFVHFGLYSILGRGEWAMELVRTAKKAGCRYITLTTRHHDGFALYDTCGLSTFDAPHSKCGRDLIREFVFCCRYGSNMLLNVGPMADGSRIQCRPI